VEAQKYIVPGLIACEALTLLVAETTHGKSLALKQLALAICDREPEWLGFEMNHTANNGGIVILCSGEETYAKAASDIQKMRGKDELPDNLTLYGKGSGKNLRKLLETHKHDKVAAVIVDPMRPYLKGSEKEGEPADLIFSLVDETVARTEGCVPVLSHHLTKYPENVRLDNLGDWIRGTQVILDRPRAHLGLIRCPTNITEFGVVGRGKDAPLWNHSEARFEGERLLQLDEVTGRLQPAGEVGENLAAGVAAEEREVLLAVVKLLISQGKRVTRTGKNGLFANRARTEIAGWTRGKVLAGKWEQE
jgi:hypothetical protein